MMIFPDLLRNPRLLPLCCLIGVSNAAPIPSIHPEYNATLKPILPLEQGWEQPPLLARTRVWWWWLNGNTDKETITRDLEAMKANGIGGANVIDAGGDSQDGNRPVPHGPDFGSPEWRGLFRHAVVEADRLGLELGFNIQSGWNLGGPSVSAEESSKKVTFTSRELDGGRLVDERLEEPAKVDGIYQDVAVVAVPVAASRSKSPCVLKAGSSQDGGAAELAMDGDAETHWVSAGKRVTAESPAWLDLEFPKPVKIDRLMITPRPGYGPRRGTLQYENAAGKLADLTGFEQENKNAPLEHAFDAVTTRRLRILVTDAWDVKPGPARNVQIAEVSAGRDGDWVTGVSSPTGGRLPNLDQKAYFKYPGQFTAAEAWHLLDSGPDAPGDDACAPEKVVDLTAMMRSGTLRWQAPPGRWQVIRLGYTSSGAHVSTHSENAGGRAIDYLDRETLDSYWLKTLDPIFNEVKPYLGKSLRFLHTDSWELGPVNWTRRMPGEFKRLRGYDIRPWLPVLAGRIIGNRDASTRFLNDFRRTLADLMAENKYAGFSEKAHKLGIGTHPESGGPHAGPMDALMNLGINDVPMGEFWSTSPRHRVRDDQRFFVKQTTSAANTYGRRVSMAEAFTNIGRHWQHDPRSLKATFDRAACEGHNLTMWHTFSSSTKAHGMPGAAYFAGEHFNPNVTWWAQGRAFVDYMNRCHFMLQQGLAAADVLHFYGENVPSFVRLKRDDPAKCLPGHDYDVIDKRALLERVSVDAGGRAVLPEGTTYRLLSLEPRDVISLPLLRHVAGLVEKGLTVVGPRPRRSYSLSGGAEADAAFTKLCDHLWGEGASGMKRVGKGRVIWGRTAREVFEADGVPADFSWSGGDGDTFIDFIQRRTDEARIYYVANRNDRPEDVEWRFRVSGMVPEFWDPVTGVRRDATRYRFENGITVVPYPMDGEQSLFVLFRKAAAADAPDGAPNVPRLVKRFDIDGAWKVSFDPEWGGPASIGFERLIDWTQHPDPGIRHYSGAAVYQKSFRSDAAGEPAVLDLGMVESLCEVTLNGEDLGVLWAYPFRVDVTGKLRKGENELRVKVVNLWCNRIIGDAGLPPEKRLTRTNITRLTKDTPLEPSGLMGPVRILGPER